jgi:bifunctional DNA-binding transcriptional regulator/antitoxin component of YhaV-PrlF toxin-antitoxin module
MYRGASPRGSGHAQHHHRHGQTVIPAPIRARFSLGPSQRLEWIVEAFRGMGRIGGSSQRLLADREADRV